MEVVLPTSAKPSEPSHIVATKALIPARDVKLSKVEAPKSTDLDEAEGVEPPFTESESGVLPIGRCLNIQ